ncbi:MAG: diacylglycerol kinase, partial [Microbacterium sp.]|nr:diacylglycerol kinase [Microbacterium sp.]
QELDVEAAADAVAAGVTRSLDLARVTRGDGTSEYFGTVLASGFDSRVNDRANAMRWPRGGSRYNIAILIEFVRLRGIPFTLDLELADGTREALESDLVMATVGNGRTYGGGIPICPDADAADGLLDVTLVRPAGRLHLLRLLPRVYRGTHVTLPEVATYRVRSVRLDAPDVTAYADGDPIGSLPLTVDVAPGALTLFMSPS